MAERTLWPALVIIQRDDETGFSPAPPDLPLEERVSARLDEFSVVAIEDLTLLPLPPGGLWDPTFPLPSDPPPSPLNWRVFFADSGDRDAAALALRPAFPALTIESCDVPDEDWAARSQREMTAVTAGSFVVAPPWDMPTDVPPGHSLIVIEPSRGFGTGHHASTRLCLRALSQATIHGARVLDLGTGSGVLAMAASMRGASEVTAIDSDPDAIESAQASAALNPGARGITWVVEDFRDARSMSRTGAPWDVVLANLTGGMLVSSAPQIRELIQDGGYLIASGFDEDERPGVERALGLTARSAVVEDRWVGLTLSR